MDLERKRLLISAGGAGRGLATSIAELARGLGAAVVVAGRVTDRPGEDPGSPQPQGAEVLELDATESADHPALQEALAARWGGVDGAVHVIGPGQPEGQGAIDPGEAMRRATAAFRVGAYSLSAVARAVAPLMREPAGLSASIVGVSAGGAQGDRMAGAVQDALEGVNRYAACELGPRGVRVNLVVAGPLTAPAIAGKSSDEALSRPLRQPPLGWEVGDLAPVARAACFLLSDWARGISGDVLHVDGGMHLGAR